MVSCIQLEMQNWSGILMLTGQMIAPTIIQSQGMPSFTLGEWFLGCPSNNPLLHLPPPMPNILWPWRLQRNWFGSIVCSPNFRKRSWGQQFCTLTTVLLTSLLGIPSTMLQPNTLTFDTIILGSVSQISQSSSSSSE